MSIEKKSLISNRTATKKAIVAKPEVTKVAATRVTANFSRIQMAQTRLRPDMTRVKI